MFILRRSIRIHCFWTIHEKCCNYSINGKASRKLASNALVSIAIVTKVVTCPFLVKFFCFNTKIEVKKVKQVDNIFEQICCHCEKMSYVSSWKISVFFLIERLGLSITMEMKRSKKKIFWSNDFVKKRERIFNWQMLNCFHLQSNKKKNE